MRFTRLQVRVDLAALLLILLTSSGCEGVDTSISTKGVSLSSTISRNPTLIHERLARNAAGKDVIAAFPYVSHRFLLLIVVRSAGIRSTYA